MTSALRFALLAGLAVGLLSFLDLAARVLAQPEPSEKDGTTATVAGNATAPPYQRLLTREAAERVAALDGKIAELQRSGKFAEAVPLGKEIVDLRTRLQGADHWQTIHSRQQLLDYELLARLTHKQRAQLLEAEILNLSVVQLGKAGKSKEALPLALKALDIRGKLLGKENPRYAQSLYNLAATYQALGRYRDAEPLYRQALAVLKQALGEEDPLTASGYNRAARNLDDQGKHAAAEPLYRTALAICKKILGEEHADTATGYHNLAANLNAQAKYGAAEPLCRQALASRKKVLGEVQRDTAVSYTNLAANLSGQGNHAAAEPLHRTALAIFRKVLGDEHAYTATSYNDLAVNLDAQGKYAAAEPLYRTALAIYKKASRVADRSMARIYNNLALNLGAQGNHAAAEPLHRAALAIFKEVLGEEHPDTALAYNNLAANLSRQGQYAAAEALHRTALTSFKEGLGEEHPSTAVIYNSLAGDLSGQGKHAAAEPLYRTALAIRQKVLGEQHPRTAYSYYSLAFNLNNSGAFAAAEKTALQAANSFSTARLYVTSQGLDRAVFSQENSPFLLLAVLQARSGQALAAWQSLEADLARGLLDDLSARLSRPLNPAERDRESQFLKQLQRLDDQIVALAPAKKQTRDAKKKAEALRHDLDQLHRAFLEFQQQLTHKYGPAAGQVYQMARIQSRLAPDMALLAWVDLAGQPQAADPDGMHWACLVRCRGEPVWVQLPGSGPNGRWTAADERLPQQVRALCAAGPTSLTLQPSPAGGKGKPILPSPPRDEVKGSDWRDLTQRLARVRLGPLEKHLQAGTGLPAVKHLVVLPSRWMLGLPVEALTDRYLISYAPSGTLFAWLKERKKPAEKEVARLLALGDPAFARPAKLALQAALPRHGLLVMAVVPKPNGAGPGIQSGDVIVRYGDTTIAGLSDLTTAIKQHAEAGPEKKIPVELWRDGKTLTVAASPGPLGVQLHKQPAADVLAARRAGDKLLRAALDRTYPALPGTRREVKAIAALFPASVQLLGADASAEAVQGLAERGRLRGFRYLHFATHGELNHRVALQSALVLAPGPGAEAPNGRLTAEQMLRTWKLEAELVTLSACQTGLGQPAGGEGYLGFSQVLFIAGTRSLVVSLWQVDDTATALLMARFYANLLGKREGLKTPLSKAESLREAKQWLRTLSQSRRDALAGALARGQLRGEVVKLDRPVVPAPRTGEADAPPYAHPYYWAAFILQGDPD
jgi:hypothetical protein